MCQCALSCHHPDLTDFSSQEEAERAEEKRKKDLEDTVRQELEQREKEREERQRREQEKKAQEKAEKKRKTEEEHLLREQANANAGARIRRNSSAIMTPLPTDGTRLKRIASIEEELFTSGAPGTPLARTLSFELGLREPTKETSGMKKSSSKIDLRETLVEGEEKADLHACILTMILSLLLFPQSPCLPRLL